MATAYFNWITACEQLRIAREQLEIQRRTLTIAEKRHTAGFAPQLDVEQATSSVAATESHIPALIAQVASAKNQLSVLLGTYNSRMELTMPKAAVFEKTPVVPVGLPSELLRRRPDVIAAEADLHTAVANVGIAVADLYPRFSLTGSVSGRGNDFAQLFRENNNAWSLGGNLVQPLFQGGALRANVRAQQAAAEQAAEIEAAIRQEDLKELQERKPSSTTAITPPRCHTCKRKTKPTRKRSGFPWNPTRAVKQSSST